MISNYQEHYKLASYLSQFTRNKKLGIVLGYNNLRSIFDESYYQNLKGGILESFSRLFGSNVKLYVYPACDPGSNKIHTSDSFTPAEHLNHLYKYLKSNNKITDIKSAKIDNLHIISNDVLAMIEHNKDNWEQYVPNKVAIAIKKNHLFNYPYDVPIEEDDL